MSAIGAMIASSGGPTLVAGFRPKRASSVARASAARPLTPQSCDQPDAAPTSASTCNSSTSATTHHATGGGGRTMPGRAAAAASPTRRDALALAAASLVAAASVSPAASSLLAPAPAWAKASDMKAVGSYLPPSPPSAGVPEGYVLYAPDARTTPATRAGVIKPPFYSFSLHPSMRQQPLVNSRTGDFCFPGCAEPWYELEAKSEGIGKVFLCALFLKKLRPGSRADGGGLTVEDLGAPDVFARAVGPLITGEGYEEEDLVASSTRKEADGGVFYDLELLASTADPSGPHRVAAATVRKDVVYLFVGAASNAQWSKTGGEAALKAMAGSFRAC